jgi:hypothetical protein
MRRFSSAMGYRLFGTRDAEPWGSDRDGLMRFVCGVVACLALLTGGCSMALDDVGSVYAAPGQYDFYKCPDIASRTKSFAQREAQLTDLMQRAGQGAGGVIVNTLVYQDELNTARAQLVLLRKASDEKHCPPPAPEPPPASSLLPVH